MCSAECGDHCDVCDTNGKTLCDSGGCREGFAFDSTSKTCKRTYCLAVRQSKYDPHETRKTDFPVVLRWILNPQTRIRPHPGFNLGLILSQWALWYIPVHKLASFGVQKCFLAACLSFRFTGRRKWLKRNSQGSVF